MRFEKSCGGIIYYNKEGKKEYLLIKHLNGEHWSFPKGHMEKGETAIQTAKREILEETGLDVLINEDIFASTLYFPKKDVIKHVVFFLAESNSKIITIQESEVLSYKWVSEEEVLDALTYENDKQLFKKLI